MTPDTALVELWSSLDVTLQAKEILGLPLPVPSRPAVLFRLLQRGRTAVVEASQLPLVESLFAALPPMTEIQDKPLVVLAVEGNWPELLSSALARMTGEEKLAFAKTPVLPNLPPVHFAVKTGRVELLDVMAKAGFDLSASNEAGLPPLGLATPQSVLPLLDAGANPALPPHPEKVWRNRLGQKEAETVTRLYHTHVLERPLDPTLQAPGVVWAIRHAPLALVPFVEMLTSHGVPLSGILDGKQKHDCITVVMESRLSLATEVWTALVRHLRQHPPTPLSSNPHDPENLAMGLWMALWSGRMRQLPKKNMAFLNPDTPDFVLSEMVRAGIPKAFMQLFSRPSLEYTKRERLLADVVFPETLFQMLPEHDLPGFFEKDWVGLCLNSPVKGAPLMAAPVRQSPSFWMNHPAAARAVLLGLGTLQTKSGAHGILGEIPALVARLEPAIEDWASLIEDPALQSFRLGTRFAETWARWETKARLEQLPAGAPVKSTLRL
jgi:hypothetical protein